MAVWAIFVGLISVPLIVDAPLPEVPPVKPPVVAGADQLYVVPAGTRPFVTFAGVAVKVAPLHTVEVMFVMAGVGLTVTVTFCVLLQPLAVKV